MEQLIKQIEQWASDRNIIKGSKPIDQAMKLFSEFGELADNVGKGRDCRDDVGDVFIVLTIMSSQAGLSVLSNIDHNYEF
ncbi:MazG-like family protein, partial [Escherichia coli]